MFASFRLSMAWLHTWFGLVLGYLLMVIFFFGTLSVFDREIDRWALPQTRFGAQPMPSFDRMLAPIFASVQPEAAELEQARHRVQGELPATLKPINWSAYATHRDPVLTTFVEFAVPNNPDDPDDHVHGHITIDPRTGASLPDGQLKLGSEFFYPMHYGLHIPTVGAWLVGVAALAMLAALVSGVVIHRRLFRELFTFRPRKHVQRSALDLHNLTGAVALPFHFFFAFSGLTIFAGVYLPVSETMLQPQAQAAAAATAAAKGLAFKPAGVPAPMASVDAMVDEAKRRWAARGMPGEVGWLTVTHVGDANAYVSLYRAGSDRVALVGQGVHFQATSGRVLHEEPPPSTVASVNEFLTGLHLQHFKHWGLRWLYVLGGLAGCVCITTGFVFFVIKRKQQHAKLGLGGARWADAFAVTTVTGMLIATATMLVANRVLPVNIADRSRWEITAFLAAWVISFGHAVWRSAPVRAALIAPAWREQCAALAVIATAAVAANWWSTGDHLLKTLMSGYWPVAGFDLALLVTAAIAVVAGVKIGRRERVWSAQRMTHHTAAPRAASSHA